MQLSVIWIYRLITVEGELQKYCGMIGFKPKSSTDVESPEKAQGNGPLATNMERTFVVELSRKYASNNPVFKQVMVFLDMLFENVQSLGHSIQLEPLNPAQENIALFDIKSIKEWGVDMEGIFITNIDHLTYNSRSSGNIRIRTTVDLVYLLGSATKVKTVKENVTVRAFLMKNNIFARIVS